MARHLRLDPTPLTALSIAEKDNVPVIRTMYDLIFETRKITQRAYAFDKWWDTFDKINDWEEMLEYHHENSNPLIKRTAFSLILKRNYDNNQINRFYMMNIQDRKTISQMSFLE